jgi:hypothetical protein
MSSLRRLCVGFSLVLVWMAGAPGVLGQPAEEASAAGLWTLGIAASSDDQSNHLAVVSFAAAVTAKTWLSAFIGDTRSPRSRADIAATTHAVSLDHRVGLFGVRVGAERWGDSGSIESTDYQAGFYVQTERIKADLGFERRNIDLTASFAGLNDRIVSRTVPLVADGIAVAVRIEATDRVTVRFRLDDYDYPPGLTVLPRIDTLNSLNASTLTLAKGFVSDIRGAGVDLDVGRTLLSLDAYRDESAIDGSLLSIFDAALLLPVGRRIDLELSLGRSRSDLFGPALHGGVAIVLYGGG